MVKLVRVLGPAALLLVAFAALLAALSFGGGANPTLVDAGAFVRWGLPVAKLIMNIGVAVTIGALALAVFALSDREPLVQRAAHHALKKLTGKDFGPDEEATTSQRKAAIAAWLKWSMTHSRE